MALRHGAQLVLDELEGVSLTPGLLFSVMQEFKDLKPQTVTKYHIDHYGEFSRQCVKYSWLNLTTALNSVPDALKIGGLRAQAVLGPRCVFAIRVVSLRLQHRDPGLEQLNAVLGTALGGDFIFLPFAHVRYVNIYACGIVSVKSSSR